VHFNSEGNNSDFIFNTIDFYSDVAYNPDEEFIDLLYSVAHMPELNCDFYVLEYNAQGITFAPKECETCQPKFKIETLAFGKALLTIHQTNDFAFLEEHLVPLAYPTSSKQDTIGSDHLPSIENYLQKHSEEIKRVYYPGAGLDFSPLQLFGRYIEGVDVYYTDYMSIPEIDKVIKRLEGSINTHILTPQDFMQENWVDFWPKYMSWTEMMGRDPKDAWGRKFEFHSKELNCTLTYLGTEGVQTAKVLCHNGLAPDVLVLQDHGYGGNYASFGGENSFLHQAMQHCLPKYILMDPKERNNPLWPGYEQVTQVYLPEAYMSLPQNRNARALFKKKNG
jgi:hypothetical protein